MTEEATGDTLAAALARQGIELPSEQIARLDAYCRLLWQWNAKLNLTRHTDYEKFVARDMVDSLAFARLLEEGETVLDVGTGGGVPGIVLAVVRPDLKIALCESVGKKARAVAEIVRRLGLEVPVHAERAEEVLRSGRWRGRTLVVRAVAKLRKLLFWLAPHWDDFERVLVVKGPAWVEERGEARHHGLLRSLSLRKLASYPMPGTESESVILQIRRKQPKAASG